MKYSTFLVKKLLHNDPVDAQGLPNVVFGYGVPELVSLVYREHVQTWDSKDKELSSDQRTARDMATHWLRRLEAGYKIRLFSASPRLEATWWDTQTKSIVRRKNTSRRLILPLQDELPLCLESLQPYYVVWLLEQVDTRKLELAMYPRCLLEAVHRLVQLLADDAFSALVEKCQALYPTIPAFRPEEVKRCHFPYYRVAMWPGLRLCPPFFPDTMSLSPPPRIQRPVSYFIFHSYLEECHAVATMESSHVSTLESLNTSTQPFRGVVGLRQIYNLQGTKYLHMLNQIHPRSFHPMSAHSPYARAAKELTPVHGVGLGTILQTPTSGTTKLPENVFQACETGFSFIYMKPRILDDVKWAQEESFYEVKYRDETFHISSFTGFGMRLRLRLLDLCSAQELKGKGVAILVPDGIDQETTENIMLTCIGWLRDLGLRDIKLLSEAKCNAMSLGATAGASQKHWPALWVSFHDGPLVCTILGVDVLQDRVLQDRWGSDFTVGNLHGRLVEKLRDFVLQNTDIQAVLSNTSGNKVWQMTTLAESMRQHLPSLLQKLDKPNQEWPVQYEFDFVERHLPSVTLDISESTYREWMDYAFQHMVHQSWWDVLIGHLEHSKGILLSGGIFDICPRTSVEILTAHFQEKAKHVTNPHRLHVLHGAAMAIYAELGCRELVLQRSMGDARFRIGTLKTE